MVSQRVCRTLGGGDHFDVESLEQRARPECRCLQCRGDGVVVLVRGVRIEAHGEAEYVMKYVVQPRG